MMLQFIDTLTFVAGVSSNVLPGLQSQAWADVVCGDDMHQVCNPIKLNNPFKRFGRSVHIPPTIAGLLS